MSSDKYVEELRAAEALSLFSICDLPSNERTKLVRCVRPVDSTQCWVLSTAVGGLEGGSRDELFLSKEEAEAAYAKWTATPPEGWGWLARIREYEIIPFAALNDDPALSKLSFLPPVCPHFRFGNGKVEFGEEVVAIVKCIHVRGKPYIIYHCK